MGESYTTTDGEKHARKVKVDNIRSMSSSVEDEWRATKVA